MVKVVIIKNGKPVEEIYGGEVNHNNRMELLAVIHGLNKIEEADTVRVNTDSMYGKRHNLMDKKMLRILKTAAKKDAASHDYGATSKHS